MIRPLAGGLLGIGLTGLLASGAAAQQPDTTLRQYDMAEVVVRDASDGSARVATTQRIGVAQLALLAPTTAADVVRLIPSAHLQTNSRGEALVYLRGASERQVALFLDGVPLNVPWDARFDISLVPAALLGAVETTKGPFSVLYGPNTAGGAIDLRTKSLSRAGTLVEAEAAGGWPRRAEASGIVHVHTNTMQWDMGAAAAGRDGDALPDGAALPFSQRGDAERTNTDRRQAGAFLRIGRTLREGRRVGVTAVYLDGEKGVAPESHLDPTTESVRYWRYPQLRMGLVTLVAEEEVSASALVRAQAWVQHYAQHIDQYATAAYDVLDATQRDGDYTTGARLSARVVGPATTVRASLLGYSSLHRQVDAEGGIADPVQRYRQHTGSAGVEVLQNIGGGWSARGGAALEAFATPLTGDKPALDPQLTWSGALGFAWQPRADATLHIGGARKTRFPTLRELFGVALNKFLLNPDLQPETVWSAEAGASWERAAGRLDVAVFTQRTADAIDQRTVEVDGEKLRQRVNLDGSIVYGVEASGLWSLHERVRMEGHMTALRARGYEDDRTVPLAEKPALTALLAADARVTRGLRVSVDLSRVAGAYSPERDGFFPRLPGTWLWGGKVSQRLPVGRAALRLFGRLDNAFDAVLLPQEGLPAPGRTVTIGLSVQD